MGAMDKEDDARPAAGSSFWRRASMVCSERLGGVEEMVVLFGSGTSDGPGSVLLCENRTASAAPRWAAAAASKLRHCCGCSPEVLRHEA